MSAPAAARRPVEERAFADGAAAGRKWAFARPGDVEAAPPYPQGHPLRQVWWDGYVAGWQEARRNRGAAEPAEADGEREGRTA